ncbi:MAG: L-2-hydroxyglutarate oxidase [Bacteroidota bacterium]
MSYDVTIVGAGIVGLSVAYNLMQAKPELKLAVVEKEDEVAKHQTGRNSGVIHSGIYYKPGSSKAINCKKGYDLMLSFCKEHGIDHDICGKLIVAVEPEEEPALNNIYERGLENGLEGLKILDKEALSEIEPYVRGTKGIFVPQTGIVNYKQVTLKLEALLKEAGVTFIYNSAVKEIINEEGKRILKCSSSDISSRFLINCAGLYSDKIAEMDGVKLNARIIPFKGEYYLLKRDKRHLVKNLIYPVPNPAFPFLGVHFTRRISGEVDAGPNAVLAFRREGYNKFDFKAKEFFESVFYRGFIKVAFKYWRVGLYEMYRSFSKKAFVRALQKLIPEVTAQDLTVGNSGVRAQLCEVNGKLVDDFLIKYSDKAVHVINAPSPAATSSLQIGKMICDKTLPLLI